MSIKINIQTGKQENIVVIDDTTKKLNSLNIHYLLFTIHINLQNLVI